MNVRISTKPHIYVGFLRDSALHHHVGIAGVQERIQRKASGEKPPSQKGADILIDGRNAKITGYENEYPLLPIVLGNVQPGVEIASI